MRTICLTAGLLFAGLLAAQPVAQLSLEDAWNYSRQNYPSVKQKELVKKTASMTIDNLQKGFLPQVSVTGQATYQSDVTSVPISIPGFSIDPPSRDQYKLVADISQLLYDGGLTKEQKALQQLNATVEDQKLEVELYKVKERVSQLFLGMLYIDEQLKQVDLVKNDIQTGIRRVEAQVQNGVSFKSSLNMLKAELLKADQRAIELRSSRKGLVDMLALFTGKELDETLLLTRPEAPAPMYSAPITRPEIRLFDVQQQFIGHQDKLIRAKNQPRASLFAQGGYGRPALNLLKNEFDFFYIGGLRFNWSLGGLYTKKKEKELVAVNRQSVGIQKETFLLNTQTQLKQQQAEIAKLEKLVASDDEIIGLRKTVTDAAKAQLENGVITANDYLKEVNAEDQARQLRIGHEVQLLQARINYQTLSGN